MKSSSKKSEISDDDFKFEVGATYENMKGGYEVVSIRNDSMVIRWKDGTEVNTSVELQKRIIDRMAFEKEKEEALKQEKAKKKKKSK